MMMTSQTKIEFDPLTLRAVEDRLDQAEQVVVVSHARPDGDAVSSVLAVGLALEEIGKSVQMVLADGVPSSLRFLAGADRIKKSYTEPVDTVIVVDCGEFNRVGRLEPPVDRVDINIDHHIVNNGFAEFNLIDPEAVSTTEILANLFPLIGLPLTPAVVSALMTGIVTDSQGFRVQTTRPESLHTAAHLLSLGADLTAIYYEALTKKSYPATRYWGVGLEKVQKQGIVAWTTLTIEDRQQVDYSGRDDADMVNQLTNIDGVGVAVIFVEQTENQVKISWRARGNYNVAQVAQQFGGGGHVAAAGAMIDGPLAEVQDKVMKATLSAFL